MLLARCLLPVGGVWAQTHAGSVVANYLSHGVRGVLMGPPYRIEALARNAVANLWRTRLIRDARAQASGQGGY